MAKPEAGPASQEIWGERSIHIVNLDSETDLAIRSLLSRKGVAKPVRIDLRFNGCCDASLGLCVDALNENDLSEETDGLVFIIDRETFQLTGEITISYVSREGGDGYVITSNKPVSEWEGFSMTDIKF